MTEEEWRACKEPEKMLRALGGKVKARKRRLFAVGCCRLIWPLMGKNTRRAVEVAERFADRQATAKELAACEAALKGSHFAVRAARYTCAPTGRLTRFAVIASRKAALAVARAAEPRLDQSLEPGCRAERARQAQVLQDLFGPLPFRPIPIDRAWLAWNDGTVSKLARAVYDERAFDRLPILADALEDAGCADENIWGHCRGEGPHVRGCWVVDLLLGKG
jgi:hypothetical protein